MDTLSQFIKFRELYDLSNPFGLEKIRACLNISSDEAAKLCKKWKQVGLIQPTICGNVYTYTNVLDGY